MKPAVNRCSCGVTDASHRCLLNMRTQSDADGIVLTLDFTDPEVLRGQIHSHRKTTSSRRPGKVIAGTVRREAEERRLEQCPDCGFTRWSDDVPHAVHWHGSMKHKVDCVGRLVPEGEQ